MKEMLLGRDVITRNVILQTSALLQEMVVFGFGGCFGGFF